MTIKLCIVASAVLLVSCNKPSIDDEKLFSTVPINDAEAAHQQVELAKQSSPKVKWVEVRPAPDEPNPVTLIITHTGKKPK